MIGSVNIIPALRIPRFYKGFLVIARSLNFRTRNPKEPHFPRKRMVEVCKPVYIPERIPEHLTCLQNQLVKEEPHPYEIILSKELKQKVDESKMILIYHVNSLKYEDEKKLYRAFFKKNLFFHMYNNNVLNLVFKNTKYETILQLFESNAGIVFCSEVLINDALKLSKQVKDKVVLLAGIIEDGLYSTSQLASINQALKRNIHGEMVQNISAPSESICRSVNHHMNLLSHYLTEISKGEK